MGKRKQKITSFVLPVKILTCLTIISAVLFLYFSTRGINLPFVGYNAWNYNTYSLIAHNYNSFGWIQTKLAPIILVSPQLSEHPEYYLHHPPLISVIQAIFFSLFGESFMVGRLSVIFFSSLSMLLVFLLGKELKGKIYAYILTISYAILPAAVLFGRMIGQEALVLFFALFTLYNLLRLIKTNSKKYFILTSLGVVLGVLSDWPMIYFVYTIVPWLWIKKEKKLAIYLVSLATSIGVGYLFYIYVIMGGFTDLIHAISVRSLGQLTQLTFWPFRWGGSILIRLFFYFNPVFVLMFVYGIFLLVKQKIISFDQKLLIYCLLSWGTLHVILYPEGSFGHPYWIYYLVVGFILVISLVIMKLFEDRKYVVLLFLLIFSVGYIWRLELWKTKEIEGNVWRYNIGKSISHNFPAYSRMFIHPNSPIDYDLLQYAFSYDVNVVPPTEIQKYISQVPYLYVCSKTCDLSYDLVYLKTAYPYRKVVDKNTEVYIFSIARPPKQIYIPETKQNQKPTSNYASYSMVKRIYLSILHITSMPQL